MREPTPELRELLSRVEALRGALAQVIVGQRRPVEEILAALLAGGHVLLEGVPGVAKTLMARSLAQCLGLAFRRIQFTPDLMPADITGTSVFDLQKGAFHLQRGPVFTNVVLADEINRTPPKTQAALLEAMQERQVTIDGESHALADPFFVIATQNPLDHEGTYPLPEAQLDRFLLKVMVGYPSAEEELDIYRRYLDGRLTLGTGTVELPVVMAPGDLPRFRTALRDVHVEEKVLGYLRQVVAATRDSPFVSAGASPRAGMALLAVARAWAAMEGRAFLIPDDVKRMAGPVLHHRLLLTPEAELEGRGVEDVLRGLVEGIEVPR
jgi:MoxR-like ATPase